MPRTYSVLRLKYLLSLARVTFSAALEGQEYDYTHFWDEESEDGRQEVELGF